MGHEPTFMSADELIAYARLTWRARLTEHQASVLRLAERTLGEARSLQHVYETQCRRAVEPLLRQHAALMAQLPPLPVIITPEETDGQSVCKTQAPSSADASGSP